MADDAPAKKPRGRPPLKFGEPSVQCNLSLSVSDYDRACRLAQRNGVSVPQILRTAFRLAIKQRTLDE